MTKRISLTLPDDIYTELQTLAKEGEIADDGTEFNLTIAEIIRRAVYEYLNAPATPNSPLAGYIEGIAGKTPRNGGKIAGHGGKRPGSGRKAK